MAKKENILIDQGSIFTKIFPVYKYANGIPFDFTGYAGNTKMKAYYYEGNAISFTTTLSNNGVVTISLTAEDSLLIVPGRYIYNVEAATSASNTIRLFEGIAIVTPEV